MAIVEHETITIPKWADRITVEQKGDVLLIHGEGRISAPVTPEGLTSEQDLLRQYTQYGRLWSEKRSGKRPPHIQFANCRSDADLIAFVERFGPVYASSVMTHERLKTATAQQRMDGLRRDRTIFTGAIRIVAELGGGKKGEAPKVAEGLAEIVEGVHLPGPKEEIRTVPHFSQGWWYGTDIIPLIKLIAQEQPWDDRKEPMASCIRTMQGGAARRYARLALCELLNHFAPYLVPAGNRIMELPRHEPSSILPALYFMLRQDCLRDQPITMCNQRDCGKFYAVERFGQRFCSAECSRLQRQREYWERRGRIQRQGRLAKLRASRKGR